MNLFKLNRKVASDRAKGDAARDRQDWAEAAHAYQRHLDLAVDDADIWVQLGHAFKEANRLEDAAGAYRRATVLLPADDDAAIHLAHVLKRLDRSAEAVATFARIFARSGLGEAHAELASLPGGQEVLRRLEGAADHVLEVGTVYFELDDMLGFLEAHRTLSGIQRVQAGVIRHVLSNEGREHDGRHIFVLNPGNGRLLFQLKDDDLSEMLDHLDSAEVDHNRLKNQIARARRSAIAIKPIAGQTLIALGAFWGNGGLASRYLSLKRAGVRLGAYIYDIIPISHYEYCDHGLSHEFRLSFCDAVHVFDFLLAISEFTAREVRLFLASAGLDDTPVETVPLAHVSRDQPAVRLNFSRALDVLRGRPYALMVSTIEARKNHAYLIAAWKHFIDEGLDPPDLVFVGRVGWRVQGLISLLEETRYLEGRVHVISDLADTDLDALYENCLFTAFPSFVEGWGLPVGESLSHGKPCVASSTSSIPEVGAELVDYLDPLNLRDGLNVLRRMAFDAEYRAERSANITTHFKPRLWTDVGRDLLEAVDRLSQKVRIASSQVERETAAAVPFHAGAVFRPADLSPRRALPSGYERSPGRLMLQSGWSSIDAFGCPINGSLGTITFRSDLPAGSTIIVYLVFAAGPDGCRGSQSEDIELKVEIPGPSEVSFRRNTSVVRVRRGKRVVLNLTGEVGSGGLVSVFISTTRGLEKVRRRVSKVREIHASLVLIGHAAKIDTNGRTDLQDRVLESL